MLDDDDYDDDVEFVVWLIGERRLPYFQPEQLTGISLSRMPDTPQAEFEPA